MKKYFLAYKCPNCGESLKISGSSFNCTNNHNFDIAKEGYVNLILANQKSSLNSGDSKEMIQARNKFLEKGYYDFLVEKILNMLGDKKFEKILEIGCGTGFYLNKLSTALKSELAMGSDVSKEAIKFAAKKYKDIYFSVNNSFNLSFVDGLFDLMISIFSPFAINEIERVLAKHGLFILVRPGPNHFKEIYERIGMPTKEKGQVEFANLRLLETQQISQKVTISNEDLRLLIEMSPLFWKIKEKDFGEGLENITFDFLVSIFG